MKTKPINEALAQHGGMVSKLAAAVGVTRQALDEAIRADRYSAALAEKLEKATGICRSRFVFGDNWKPLPRRKRKAA